MGHTNNFTHNPAVLLINTKIIGCRWGCSLSRRNQYTSTEKLTFEGPPLSPSIGVTKPIATTTTDPSQSFQLSPHPPLLPSLMRKYGRKVLPWIRRDTLSDTGDVWPWTADRRPLPNSCHLPCSSMSVTHDSCRVHTSREHDHVTHDTRT